MFKGFKGFVKEFEYTNKESKKVLHIAKTLWKDISLSMGTSFPDQDTRQWFQIHSVKAIDENRFNLCFSHQFLSKESELHTEMIELVEHQFKYAESCNVTVNSHSSCSENRMVLHADIHFTIKENIVPLGKKIKCSLEKTKVILLRRGRTEMPLIAD